PSHISLFVVYRSGIMLNSYPNESSQSFFFFQAEDGIRDRNVTGVQTCALPIYLKENGVSIWDEWATDDGELGPVYGQQWRSWPGQDGTVIDQITNVVNDIKQQPDSRRLLVTAWNPTVLPDTRISPKENAALGRQALPPCHCLFQFYVADGKLSCQLYQRSGDIFL